MSVLGDKRPDEDVVLVFRPPENPAAQIAGITPFKSLRLRLDELLEWFKGLNVESIDLWIEGAWKAGNRTELFLSVEGKTGAKLTLRPYSIGRQLSNPPRNAETTEAPEASNAAAKEIQELKEKLEKATAQQKLSTVTALFSPSGGIERHVVSLIDSALGSIEMAAYEFTNQYIEKAILEAIRRGVKVDILLDNLATLGRQAEVHDNLLAAGAEIRLISPRRGAMHDKYIIVDGKSVQWGSYNYIERAETTNFENATFVSDSTLAQQYHSDFASIFNQAKPESRGIRRSFSRFFRHFARRSDVE
jgi:phosphatidylserine/phosphatidylglycerophosphate/cardiolipin synthase-like enzyme